MTTTKANDPMSGKTNTPTTPVGSEPQAMVKLAITSIKDGGAQMRTEMRAETVSEYADDLLDGATFPPVVVFHDDTDYWLADGFHRKAAAQKAGFETIEAEVRKGSQRDAILYGIGANAAHGLRRTNADKRRAVERLLTDPEWARWSDREVAKAARVDHKTVAKIRRELIGDFPTAAGLSGGGGGIPVGRGGVGKLADNGHASLIEDVLRKVPNEALIAECRRRGLVRND